MADLKQLLTVKDVQDLWGVSRSWIYDLAARGVLPAIRLGGMLRFDVEDLSRWLEQRKARGDRVVISIRGS